MLIAVPLIVILMAVVALAGAAMARATSDAFNSWLGRVLEDAGAFIIPGARASLQLARWIARKLGDHFEGVERLAVTWFAALAQYADTIITTAVFWPIRLATVVGWLIDVEIPRIARAVAAQAVAGVHALPGRVKVIERTVFKFPKLAEAKAKALIAGAVAAYIAPYLFPLRWLRSHFHALTAVLPHALPVPFGRTIAQIRRRLRKLEAEQVVGAAAIAVVATGLTRLGLGWLRCSSLRRLGKRVGCGGFAFLEELLFTGFSAFVVTDLCRFTDLLIKTTERLRPVLMELVDVEDALVNCHGTVKPSEYALPALSLPPMPAPSVLAA